MPCLQENLARRRGRQDEHQYRYLRLARLYSDRLRRQHQREAQHDILQRASAARSRGLLQGPQPLHVRSLSSQTREIAASHREH